MPSAQSTWDREVALREILGYLNFSEGKPDSRFQTNLNEFFRQAGLEPWRDLESALRDCLGAVRGTSSAFRDTRQAEAVIDLIFGHLLPAYRAHHADLLFHLKDADINQGFFVARACEALLAEGPPWSEADRVIRGTLARLNDFVGHRPVAVLERQKCEPYHHERVRPSPLFIRGAGVAFGRFHDLIVTALDILAGCDREILQEAQFNLDLLDELAVDPRAYDFSHPVNQRPNYQFGEWDPHTIDDQGRYRRFVVRQVTLDGLLQRVENAGKAAAPSHNPDPWLFEAATVLAGTILMASGTSGSGPSAYDSSVTLATLVPKIALYRDAFYESCLRVVPGSHGERLRQESVNLRQPFGGARQHLNQFLARYRAAQLQNAHLATLCARMGYPEASMDYAHRIPAVSTRIHCEIECRITLCEECLERGESRDALRLISELDDWLQRGIACGALVDPWNILGFQAQFSVFAARENSVPDMRVDQLTSLMEQIFTLYARLLAEAAGQGSAEIERQATAQMQKLAAWWDRFATTEVGDVRRVHGGEAVDAATHVARALGLWHQAGESAGDIKFWRQHCEGFSSPRAFAQVVQALLRKNDRVSAMALLIRWLNQSSDVPLEQEPHSFFELAHQWIQRALAADLPPPEIRLLILKFFDFLEANAEAYWHVPGLEFGQSIDELGGTSDPDEDVDEQGVYSAAYEGVSYRDSAEDGQVGEVVDDGIPSGEFELEATLDRVEIRLKFIALLARLWQLAADFLAASPTAGARDKPSESPPVAALSMHPEASPTDSRDSTALVSWRQQLEQNRQDLDKLLHALQQSEIPKPLGSHDSLIEYDRRRSIKQHLVYLVIDTLVETNQAIMRVLRNTGPDALQEITSGWQILAVEMDCALRRGNAQEVRDRLQPFLQEVATVPILYRRWDRGGSPQDIVAARCVQETLKLLVESLPRVGLLRETYRVLRTAYAMEQEHPVSGEGVTEFDHLYRAGFRAVIESVLDASNSWTPYEQGDQPLLECLELLSEPFMDMWLEHSQSVRLSTLDRINSDAGWQRIGQFIETYGHDLLTPQFLTYGNLRAIADQGGLRYLECLADERDPLHPLRLMEDLNQKITRQDAATLLDLIVAIFLENFEEYRDYNTTTTQSDYGERFFTLFEFLRLKAWYERTSWNLQPVTEVHELLARKGKPSAARMWQEAISGKTSATAEALIEQLTELERNTGVRLATVRDRLSERFARPLTLDRARALVEPAMQRPASADQVEPAHAFARLCEEISDFVESPTGVGLDVPQWLRALEDEVARIRADRDLPLAKESISAIPPITRSEITHQLESWNELP